MSDHTCQMLTVSTAHITENTCNIALPSLTGQIPIWEKTDAGWFIYARLDTLGLDADIPADLLPLLEYAQQQDCEYIMLDKDWPTLADLPIYDW